MLDDLLPTITTVDQAQLERKVQKLYQGFLHRGVHDDDEALRLDRQAHADYLCSGLGELPAGFSSLDASRTWICYWVVHSLALLRQPLPDTPSREDIIAFLASCQDPGGGFGGGPYQLPHLATTYAAVAALVTLGGGDALGVVDRPGLLRFILRMCVPPTLGGGMTMHEGGEVDVRGCYCALACCHMLGLDIEEVVDACALVHHVAACQSYEGGIGGEPWNEAHGGYTFCGFAALALAGKSAEVDLGRLARWVSRMQGWVEGGFQGRTCKLVDGCYSFWQAATMPLLRRELLDGHTAATGHLSRQSAVAASAAAESEGCEGAEAEQLRRAAARVAEELSSDDAAAAFVERLQPHPPHVAARLELERVQQRLDDAVDQSLRLEERYRQAVHAAAEEEDADDLKRQAFAAMQEASDVQQAVLSAQAHLDTAACAAPVLLERYTSGEGAAASAESSPRDVLYHPSALQLWLLAACQAPHGGMRDKPGKPCDYYHTCYCLSGLSSCQHASGVVLGGRRNLLARAHPLCNVVEERVEAAVAFFARVQLR